MSDTIEWPSDLVDRHPGTTHFVELFAVDHLPEPLRTVSLYSGHLAAAMMTELADGPELSAGLRKLLEAKDCFVRQCVADRKKREAADVER
jgi:HEAT repeat protein